MPSNPPIQAPTYRDQEVRAIHDPYGGGFFLPDEPRHTGHPASSGGRGPDFGSQGFDHDDEWSSRFEHDGCHQGHHGDDGGGLGWGPAEWGAAGGFEHVLGGLLGGAGGEPVVLMPVDHLVINHDTLIQNTLNEATNVVFNTAPGGTIDIGGDVDAISNQSLDVFSLQSHATGEPGGVFGLDIAGSPFEGALLGGVGGLDAVLYGHLPAATAGGPSPLVIIPVEHLEINENTLVQNTLNQQTNVVFNAAAGGTIDVGGNVEAVSDQHATVHALSGGADLLPHA